MARPKEFDRDQALDRAMQVFWTRRYEATSIGADRPFKLGPRSQGG